MSNQVHCANYSLFPIVTYCAKPYTSSGGKKDLKPSFLVFLLQLVLAGLVDLVGSEDWDGLVVLWVVKVTSSGYCLVIG